MESYKKPQSYCHDGGSRTEEEAPIIDHVRKICTQGPRPRSISDLWKNTSNTSSTSWSNRSTFCHTTEHYQSEHLHFWTTKDELVDLLLNHEEELKIMYSKMCESALYIGKKCDEHPIPPGSVALAKCMGCNWPCDLGESTCRSGVQFVKEIYHNDHLHTLNILIPVSCALLGYPESDDKFVKILGNVTTEAKVINHLNMFYAKMIDRLEYGLPGMLIGVLDNCESYPKLLHQTAGLISLMISRRPIHFLHPLPQIQFVSALNKYMDKISQVVGTSCCLVDDHFATVAFLNVIPLLYHFGSWKDAHRVLKFSEIVQVLGMIAVNICLSITPPHGDDSFDSQPSLVDLPETISPRIVVLPIFADNQEDDNQTAHTSSSANTASNSKKGGRLELLTRRPKSFALICTLEILGWYSHNGIDLRVPLVTGNDAPAYLPDMMKQYKDRIIHLVEKIEKEGLFSCKYIQAILSAIAKKQKVPKPCMTRSLLYGPLSSFRRRCGLPSCRSPMAEFRCKGNCGGLEYYCSREHQKRHWKEHKGYCQKHAVVTNRGN